MEHRNFDESRPAKKYDNILSGLILLGIGAVLIARKSGAYLPDWLFTWPMILIIVALFVGIKTSFRDVSWLILGIIGSLFLLNEIWPDISIRPYIWPGIIIMVGLLLIFSPRKLQSGVNRRNRHKWKTSQSATEEAVEIKGAETKPPGDEVLDIVSIFSHIKKTVFTKNFRGGEAVCIFGGTDINLMQADIQGPIVLELVQIFGGANLLIPPHWQVRSDCTAVFGGIDDKRPPVDSYDPDKIVILKGATIFGGIMIKSY